MKILIASGAELIGSAVIRHIILGTQNSAVSLDKRTYAGNLKSLASGRYAFELLDSCDRAGVERVLREHSPDAVMH